MQIKPIESMDACSNVRNARMTMESMYTTRLLDVEGVLPTRPRTV